MAMDLLASYHDEAVRFEVEYNDADLRVSLIRCINNGTGSAFCEVYDQDGEPVFIFEFAAGTTRVLSFVADFYMIEIAPGYYAFPIQCRFRYEP